MGMFTVKSAYRLAIRLNEEWMGGQSSRAHPDGQRPMWNGVWQLKIPQKIKVFTWKLINQGLPTKINKYRRSLESTTICDLCGLEPETEHHAVISCPQARNLRLAMRRYWDLPSEDKLRYNGPEWLLTLLDTISVDMRDYMVLLLWRTWQVHNDITHNGKNISVTSSVASLRSYWETLMQNSQHSRAADEKGKYSILTAKAMKWISMSNGGARLKHRWSTPEQGWVKINVDGAFTEQR